MRILITGIAGSGGSYLTEYIRSNHPTVSVFGFSRWHSTSQSNLGDPNVTVLEVDLMDFPSVLRGLEFARPDIIFHLAAHANVGVSFKQPASVISNNVLGTVNLLEGIRFLGGLDPVIQICSTSEVYGQVSEKETPIKEDQPLRPSSPYAVSKVAQDLLGYTYFRSYQMKIIRTRMFAYINPCRADLFSSSFARQIADAEKRGERGIIRHGNLNSVRTLIDVRDAMKSYWVAAEKCSVGEVYNIGGKTILSVGEVLDRLIEKSKVPIKKELDLTRLRPSDVTLQIPDTTKFYEATNWEPKISFDDSLEFLLNYWRRKAEINV